MTVYVDKPINKYGRMTMCHMLADTEKELENMANLLGLNLKWWQYKNTPKSHFDICKSKRKQTINLGAVEIDRKQLVKLIKSKR